MRRQRPSPGPADQRPAPLLEQCLRLVAPTVLERDNPRHHTRIRLLGPDELERQFTVAAELDELAQKIGDRELRTNALWVRYIVSLSRGDSLEAGEAPTQQRVGQRLRVADPSRMATVAAPSETRGSSEG